LARSRCPVGLRTGGKRLWRQVTDEFELGEHETAVLLQACRVADLLDRLQDVIDTSDVVVSSPQGVKTHPAVVEFRQQALTLAKCMTSLRIPLDNDQLTARPQRTSRRGAQ
jgi:hypothetical protein